MYIGELYYHKSMEGQVPPLINCALTMYRGRDKHLIQLSRLILITSLRASESLLPLLGRRENRHRGRRPPARSHTPSGWLPWSLPLSVMQKNVQKNVGALQGSGCRGSAQNFSRFKQRLLTTAQEGEPEQGSVLCHYAVFFFFKKKESSKLARQLSQ